MSNIPYKLQLSKGANNASIEIDAINNITVSDPNITLNGAVNVNNNYILPQSSPVAGNSYLLSAGAGNQLSFSQYSPVSLSQFQYNFYVSTSGNDANDGSISSPYKTIGACMTFVDTLSVNTTKINSSGTINLKKIKLLS